jgi:ferrochelatase
VETLVELDEEYAALARAVNLPFYLRAPAIGEDVAFIEGLAETVAAALGVRGVCPRGAACPDGFARCPHLPARVTAEAA